MSHIVNILASVGHVTLCCNCLTVLSQHKSQHRWPWRQQSMACFNKTLFRKRLTVLAPDVCIGIVYIIQQMIGRLDASPLTQLQGGHQS